MNKPAPANVNMPAKAPATVSNASWVARPMLGGKAKDASIYDYMTFKNIVLFAGAVAFLLFVGNVASPRIAFLFTGLLGIAGLIGFEMAARKKWEKDVMTRFYQMSEEYDRLVRETARNRNDMAVLKKNLAGAGSLARSYGRTPGEAVEQRMIKSIAEQLSRLGDAVLEEADDQASAFDIGAFEKEASVKGDNDALGKRLNDDQVRQLVRAAVKQDRIDMFLQPVVNLPQRKLRFYEVFSRIRIRAEVYLPAERYIEVAMQQDMVPAIDNLLLLRALQVIRDTQEENYNRAFFCNITSRTLNDPKFMGDLVEFIAQNRNLAPRLVFELGQKDLATMNADTLSVLNGLSQLGCRFSMDQVKSLSFDFAHLEARHIRFIKAEAGLMIRELKEIGGLQRLKRLKSELDRRGIDLITEKIETERQLLELLDVEIDYGQGYLFGKPYLSEKMAA